MILQAGETVAGYVVGAQHWRWVDDGHQLQVIIELGCNVERGGASHGFVKPEERWGFVSMRRLRVSVLTGQTIPAIGFGPYLGATLRGAIERAADRGGPWV